VEVAVTVGDDVITTNGGSVSDDDDVPE